MTEALALPIIVADGLDVTIYPSRESAEGSLEAWVVDTHPAVRAFDARGQPLDLLVWRRPASSRLGRALSFRQEGVTLQRRAAPPDPETLHTLLRDYLGAVAPARLPQHPAPR